MDKSNSEFIERSSFCTSSNSIVKIWVLLEGSRRATKLTANISQVQDLNDFVPILQNEFKELRTVRPHNIDFIDNNNSPLRPSTDLQTLAKKVTNEKPLVIRYTSSNLSSK